jgi:membrane-bound lytic murein transglycosylase B
MSQRHSFVIAIVLLLTACAGQPRSVKPVVAVPQSELPTSTDKTNSTSSATGGDAVASQAQVVEESPRPFDMSRPEIVAFIDALSAKHAIPADELRALLGQGVFQPKIITAMTRPAERVLAWWEYKDRLVSNERVIRGRDFWNLHRDRLQTIETKTGVDAAIIVAIIGVETNYGRNMGSWRVLDALMTLGFDYPRRAEFFRSELEHFILLAREESWDPLAIRGSYAGAMGAPQFMPSSYRRFAVDGGAASNAPVRRDLFADWDDIVASVANYFTAHGWQSGQPVLFDASVPTELLGTLDRRNLDLNHTLASLRTSGVTFESSLPDETRAILVPAETAAGPAARIGLNNFRVITRYNRSVLYAMAVNDLAESLRTPQESSATASTAP